MHYKNGREAKSGDKVVSLEHGVAGVLHSVNARFQSPCNARIAPYSQNDPYVTLSKCLHVDDIAGGRGSRLFRAVTGKNAGLYKIAKLRNLPIGPLFAS